MKEQPLNSISAERFLSKINELSEEEFDELLEQVKEFHGNSPDAGEYVKFLEDSDRKCNVSSRII